MFLIVDALAFEGEENCMSNEFGRSTVGKNVIVSKHRERGLREKARLSSSLVPVRMPKVGSCRSTFEGGESFIGDGFDEPFGGTRVAKRSCK